MISLFRKRRPLALKLTLITTSVVVIMVLTVTIISVQRERQNFQTELEQQAILLLKTLSASTVDSLYFLDGDFIVDLMRDINRADILTFGRVYDAEGRIVADALDPAAGFSLEPDSLGQELLVAKEPVFHWQSDQLIAGQSITVGSETIGAVTVGLSTRPLAAKINYVRNQGIIVALFAIIIGLILALLLSRSITGPLQQLVEATDRISDGDLTHRVALTGRDEIAQLGNHFNRMTKQLAQTLQQMETEIEERRRAQVELEIAKNDAEAANRAKSTFLANVSHELRTPLAAVIGYSELIQEQLEYDDYEDVSHKVERILASGNQLLHLINDILDLSKIEAGRMETVLETFNVASFVTDVIMIAEPLMQKNRNNLQVVGETAEWGHLYADEARLRQVMLNLLGNAAKFTNDGTVTLSVTREQDEQDETWLCLAVTDTGIGIPSQHIPLLFKPFIQVDPSTTRRYEGTGLGLAISQRLCQMMGGYITVTSEVGHGSTFTVHLPVLPESEPLLLKNFEF